MAALTPSPHTRNTHTTHTRTHKCTPSLPPEGSNYGTVSVTIPRHTQSGAGRVFLVYTSPDGSARAVGALHGRRFGESVISARLYSEDMFAAGVLTA